MATIRLAGVDVDTDPSALVVLSGLDLSTGSATPGPSQVRINGMDVVSFDASATSHVVVGGLDLSTAQSAAAVVLSGLDISFVDPSTPNAPQPSAWRLLNGVWVEQILTVF